MKLHSKLSILAIACALAACSNDDEPTVYETSSVLPAPANVTLTDATTSTLDFSWPNVDGAVLYGYELLNSAGRAVSGGTTKDNSVQFTKLSLFTDYTVNITAMPAIGSGIAPSAPTQGAGKTLFWERVDESTGYYATELLGDESQSWKADIDEDRSAEDYQDGTFGVFTISAFYNRASGKLVFTVNDDNTITILNATGHDDNGWAMVTTGFPQAARKTLYIDESSSEFDRAKAKLTYTAKFNNSTEPKTEIFYW